MIIKKLNKLIIYLDNKLYEIKEKLGYNLLKFYGNKEEELNFDFAYYQE